MKIKPGDRIYFRRENVRSLYCYRTVRAIVPAGVKVYHLGKYIVLRPDQIERVSRPIGDKVRGRSLLSQSMYAKGIRNEDLSDKSGYSIGTVDRARRDLRVKPRTLSDLFDSITLL